MLTAITGLCYLTHSFALFLSPALAAHLFPCLMPIGLKGELSLALWLLVIGGNIQRWKEQASAAADAEC